MGKERYAMAKKSTKEETTQRKDERLSANIDRGRSKIVVKGKEPQTDDKKSDNDTNKDKYNVNSRSCEKSSLCQTKPCKIPCGNIPARYRFIFTQNIKKFVSACVII